MSYLMAAGVGAGIGVIGFWIAANLWHFWPFARRRVEEASDIERQFRNVFGIMSEERRQSLVRYYMLKHDCGQLSAMQFAVKDRDTDHRRWA